MSDQQNVGYTSEVTSIETPWELRFFISEFEMVSRHK